MPLMLTWRAGDFKAATGRAPDDITYRNFVAGVCAVSCVDGLPSRDAAGVVKSMLVCG
jgi:hypothetical protein